MHISHVSKVVYFGIPKTASRTVAKWLHENYKFIRKGQGREGPHHGLCRKCNPLIKGYFHFATVRNPFARTVSRWNHMCDRHHSPLTKESFGNYMDRLSRCHFSIDRMRMGCCKFLPPQSLWLDRASNYLNNGDKIHIVKQENLLNELRKLPFTNKPLVLPEIGKRSYGDWQDFYTPKHRKTIVDLYWDDFERFNYKTTID